MPRPKSAAAVTVALVLVLYTVSCGGPSGTDDGASGPSDEASGASDTDTRIRLQEVATIGCESCPRVEQVSVFAMGMDAEGLIWAVDRFPPHMRVFRTSGELVTAFGPSGQGPGDFRTGPMKSMNKGNAVLAAGGGSVLVYQSYPPALVGFDLEGNEISNLPIDISNPFTWAPLALVLDPTAPRAFMLGDRFGAADDGELFTVHRLDFGEESVGLVQIAAGAELFQEVNREAMPGVWFNMAVAPDGTLAVGESFGYQVVRLDAEGNVLGRFSHDAERPLKSEELLLSTRRAAKQEGKSEDEVDIYDVHFKHRGFEFDDSGRLWVLLKRPTRERSVFDVFAPDGTHLQQIDVPYFVQPNFVRGAEPAFLITGGYFVAVVRGPDDEDRIKIWRVIED